MCVLHVEHFNGSSDLKGMVTMEIYIRILHIVYNSIIIMNLCIYVYTYKV